MERPHRHNLTMRSLELIALGSWPSLELGLPSTHTISLTRTVDDRNLPTHMARMAHTLPEKARRSSSAGESLIRPCAGRFAPAISWKERNHGSLKRYAKRSS